MAIIGEALELPTAVTTPYRSTSDVLRDESLLQTLHHDASSGYFLDYGLHTEDCRLGKKSFPVDGKMQVRGGHGVDAHCAVKLFWHSAVVGLPIPSLISDPKFYF
jgi:hypothetical protein